MKRTNANVHIRLHVKCQKMRFVFMLEPLTGVSRQKNEKGETPLHLACISGNLRKVRTLLAEVGLTLVLCFLTERAYQNYTFIGGTRIFPTFNVV